MIMYPKFYEVGEIRIVETDNDVAPNLASLKIAILRPKQKATEKIDGTGWNSGEIPCQEHGVFQAGVVCGPGDIVKFLTSFHNNHFKTTSSFAFFLSSTTPQHTNLPNPSLNTESKTRSVD